MVHKHIMLYWQRYLKHHSIHCWQVRSEVGQLLCLLTKDDLSATQELNRLIMEKISVALRSHVSSPDLAANVRHEMGLLAASAQKEDSCWEFRLKYEY